MPDSTRIFLCVRLGIVHQDFGEFLVARLVDILIVVNLPELAAECNLPRTGHRLSAKQQYRVIEEGAADLIAAPRVQWFAYIDARYLGTQRMTQFANLYTHDVSCQIRTGNSGRKNRVRAIWGFGNYYTLRSAESIPIHC